MNTIKNLLKKENNIAIIGGAGCGKGIVFKSILSDLVSSNKKVLVLEPSGGKEYKQITDSFGGNHIFYKSMNNIDYNNNLTTISFSKDNQCPEIELILRILKGAENNGVEVVLIDEAWNYLKDCAKINTNINVQLIINTQFDTDILGNENSTSFKNLFRTLFLMGKNNYNIHYTYPKLLALYNIDKSVIEYLKTQGYFESIIIRENEIIEKNFKIEIEK
ncbi:hypothetical protein AN649_13515 [Clostridium sporogenes]|nr:hypothetical protein AN649_13515 [Clostridium sporogenes]